MLCAPGLSDDERQGNRLAAVRNVLDHSDRTMVWEVHAGTSEADYDIGAMTSDGTSRPPDPEPTENPEDQVLEAVRGLSAEDRMALARRLLADGSPSGDDEVDGYGDSPLRADDGRLADRRPNVLLTRRLLRVNVETLTRPASPENWARHHLHYEGTR